MIHVYPINDTKEHAFETSCPCGTVVDFSDGEAVCIHKAWDGRDMLEQAAQIMEAS